MAWSMKFFIAFMFVGALIGYFFSDHIGEAGVKMEKYLSNDKVDKFLEDDRVASEVRFKNALMDNISYFKHSRAGVCFAMLKDPAHGRVISIIYVPCELVPPAML